MKKLFSFLIFSLVCILTYGQSSELSVKKIMQDPKGWVGTSPSNITWADDSKTLYFEWNPDQNPGDSLYKISAPWKSVERVTKKEANTLPDRHFHYTKDRRKKIYSKNGDIFLVDLKSSKILQITNTLSNESDPSFTFDEKAITFTSENNLFLWNMTDQSLVQLTDFRRGNEQGEKRETLQNQWLKNDQMGLIQVLSEKENARKQKEAYLESTKPDRPEAIYTGSGNINQITLSPDRKYITYSLYKRAKTQGTIVPDYVTESGYTEDINARSKVGDDLSDLEVWIYDIENKKVYQVQSAGLPGLNDQPDYTKDYRNSNEKEVKREVYTHSPIWSDNGKNALISFRSKDNKDRWIGLLNIKDGSVKVLDRQRDEAWIGGPGIGWSFSTGDIGWMPDDEAVWFQSEESGYSHLYSVNISSGKKKALTKGDYEIFSPRISRDKKWWYFEANPDHPGIKNVYSMPIQGGDLVPITSGSGGNIAYFSPDETKIALLYSTENQPWELYIMDNKPGAKKQKLTDSPSEEWKKYAWKQPEHITFQARDNATVHARLYQPEKEKKNGAAVIFVHGAGYLHNAHTWWSSYFREYMFHNLLTDKGYTVLDIDYRGSAGYGRDWRTGIYRHMGGKDLTDQVDGVKYLIDTHQIDPKRVGIYGGSYGGFITLMGMFTEQETFAAGAALRSVTDWAHYNNGYTSNILNTPVQDSLAYRRSSPIYYAEGLQGALLICHGMVDTNVHFQDVVRLAQRLIELGKENWEFAVYPVENHGFKEPSSWTDEYSRILKLFETNLIEK